MNLLSIGRLQKHVGERLLLDLELALEESQAIVLTGVNGSGKSSLLRILSGLEPARLDEVKWQGRALHFSPYPALLRKEIVYVHQHPVMFATSVEANIAYGLKARGMQGSEIRAQVEEALEWAGVAHLRRAPTASLSGGEKQRIALARARVLRPRLLLLDEPTANLDGQAREQVIALIPTLTAGGSSVIMACHDRDLIGLPGVVRWKLREGRIEVKQRELK